MEYYDYDSWGTKTLERIDRYLHGRGKHISNTSIHNGLISDWQVQRIDDYYELPALKRKFFFQSPFDNFQTNIFRVGMLGFLERMTFQLSLLQVSKLNTYSPKNLMNCLSQGKGMLKGIYKGNGLAMLQFGLVHALPASYAQKVDSETNTVKIDMMKYFSLSFLFNVLAAPLQMAKLGLYTNKSIKASLCPSLLTPSFAFSHLLYSAHNSLFIGTLAYLFSQDFTPQSLLIAPVSLAYYLSSIHRNINIQKGLNLQPERVHTVLKSNLGRSMFPVLLLANCFAGFRYFGFMNHGRMMEEYVHENEAKGMFKGYELRTKQFRDWERYNRVKK